MPPKMLGSDKLEGARWCRTGCKPQEGCTVSFSKCMKPELFLFRGHCLNPSQPFNSVWESPRPAPLPLPAGGRLLPHAEATQPGLLCSARTRAAGAAPGTAPEGWQSCPRSHPGTARSTEPVWVPASPHRNACGTKSNGKGSSAPGCSDVRVTGINYLAPEANLNIFIYQIYKGRPLM